MPVMRVVRIANAGGYWGDDPIVSTTHPDVKATAYIRENRLLISIASWADHPVSVRLNINWAKVGVNPSDIAFNAPEIAHFQSERVFDVTELIPIEPTKGWLLYAN